MQLLKNYLHITQYIIALAASCCFSFLLCTQKPLQNYYAKANNLKRYEVAEKTLDDHKNLLQEIKLAHQHYIKKHAKIYEYFTKPQSTNKLLISLSKQIKLAHLRLLSITSEHHNPYDIIHFTCSGNYFDLLTLINHFSNEPLPFTITTGILQRNRYTLTVALMLNKLL